MGSYTEETPDGLVIYRASSLGFCPNALYLDRMGVTGEPTPDWLQRRFDQGSAAEDAILKALENRMQWRRVDIDTLRRDGWDIGEDQYENQVRVWVQVGSGNLWVRGHIDGIGQMWAAPVGQESRLGELRGLEAKLFGPDYYAKWKKEGFAGFPNYAIQVSCYMKATGLPFLFIVGLRDDDGNLVKGSDAKAELDITEVDEPPTPWPQIMGRVLGVEGRVQKGEPPDCPQPFMYPCPYYQLHEEKPGVELPPTERLLFDSLAAEYLRHGKLAEEHKDKQQEVGRNIAQFFDDKGLATSPAGENTGKVESKSADGQQYHVTDVRYWKRGFPDFDLMEQDGIDLDKYRRPGSEVRFPRITERKVGGGRKDD